MPIKEISALELAEKVESGAELTKLDRMAAGGIIRLHYQSQEARKLGGRIGGAKKKDPADWSPSYRAKMESKQRKEKK